MNKRAQKQRPSSQTGPKAIPTKIQLPGGIPLNAMPFKIVEYTDDGRPKLFELQPDGPHDMSKSDACVLFAQERWIRGRHFGKNVHERTYIAEIEKALAERELTEQERVILEHEIEALLKGAMELNGPETVDERLERLHNHFP